MTMAAPEITDRRVRVTILGYAHELNRASHLQGVMRVVPDGNRRTVLLVDPSMEGVHVEDLPRERMWQEGDVVAGDAAVYVRGADGTWKGTTTTGIAVTWTDEQVTEATAQVSDGLEVLRYQAGGVL